MFMTGKISIVKMFNLNGVIYGFYITPVKVL